MSTPSQVGTYNAAVLAARHNIPFIVVAPVSTIDLETEDGSRCASFQYQHLMVLANCKLIYSYHMISNLSFGGYSIPIEHRPPLEACLVRGALYPFVASADGAKAQATVMVTPEDLKGVYNPSFDVTPADLITAIVTEKGVAVKEAGKLSFDLSKIV
jgi:methylthioribose-1-phosphate isomerase